MTPPGPRSGRGWGWAALAAITAVALVLRVYKLGDWPLADDEIYTLRDSRIMDVLGGTKGLIFFLNYHIFGPSGLNELTMRILPAVFGVLSVPVVYLVLARLTSVGTALFGALLVAVHPEHVYWSQFARYYSLAFLMATVYPFALYWGVRERRFSWVAGGLLAATVAGLAHPSGLLPLGGVLVWGAYEFRSSERLSGRRRVWPLVGGALVALATLAYTLPILRRWLALPEQFGFGSLGMQLSHLNALGPTLVTVAGLGLLWSLRDATTRSLGVLLMLWVVVPAVFLAFVALFASAYTGYLWPSAPPLFVAGALFLHRCVEHPWGGGGARWAVVALATILIVTPIPSLLSHYMDGSRHDFRTPATLVLEQARPGDVVFADQHELSLHYLEGAEGLSFRGFSRDQVELARALEEASPGDGSVWIIAEYIGRGGFGDKTLDEVGPWVREHCHEVAVFGTFRLDYKLNQTRLHHCPARHHEAGLEAL